VSYGPQNATIMSSHAGAWDVDNAREAQSIQRGVSCRWIPANNAWYCHWFWGIWAHYPCKHHG